MEQTEPSVGPFRADALDRRRFLGAVGTGSAAALGLVVLGCSDDSPAASDPSPSSTTVDDAPSSTAGPGDEDGGTAAGTPVSTVFRAADFAALGVCVLSPEQTAGPFPTETQIERRDVTEGLAGHPLRLGLQVVDESCVPIEGAMVEIWHCDVDGDYSAYTDGATADDAGPGTTFLRGSQRTNAEGIVEFHSNYPGWYTGRAVHVHTKVHLDDATVLTSQIYFPDEYSRQVFTEDPYAVHGDPDTTNAQDGIAGDPAAEGSLAHAMADDAMSGSRALLVLGVDPEAVSDGRSGGPGMGGPGMGGPGRPPG